MQRSFRRLVPPARLLAPILAISGLLVGCSDLLLQGLGGTQEPALDPGALEEATPTPALNTVPTLTLPPLDEEEPGGERERSALVVWAPAYLVPTADTSGGAALLDQIAAFDEAHPAIPVEFYAKGTSGPGSILSYLRTAPPVAPGVLPDAVLLSRESLIVAAREQLIVPIGGLIDAELLAGLYPVAVELGTVDNTLVGLPYVLEVEHAVYRESLFSSPPDSFDAVLDSSVPFLFPAGPQTTVNHTLLLQYMAAGGRLADEAGTPTVDAAALREVLTFYQQAHASGVIDPVLFQIVDPMETWIAYRDRAAGFSMVTSRLYLAEREQARATTGLSWLPTPRGQAFTLATGWSWAIVTTDPERQEQAIELIHHLMEPVNQGTFTRAASWLPSHRSALTVWGSGDPYASFGNTLLMNAAPVPDASLQTAVGPALQAALEDVLLNGVQPVQAANLAAQTVNPAPAEEP